MKVTFRVYEYKETLEKEFSSVEELGQMMEQMVLDNPDLFLEPFFEIDSGCVTDICDIQDDECTDNRPPAEGV